MQIIQHVKRGYGQPTSPPEEIGIHYIDVVTNELYISRGKISVNDWGEPLSTALVPGSNGLVFGWSDASGQTWYVLDKLGVEEDAVLTKDGSMLAAATSYANTSVEGLINPSPVTNGDDETL